MKYTKKLTDKIFNSISDKMPKISETEQAAIDAGNTWLESDIFQANINWKEFLSLEKDKLTDEEQTFISKKVIPLLKKIDNQKIDENKDLNEDTWNYLKKEKFFSFIIPKEYGGLGFSAKANSTIVAMIASVSSTLAVTVMVPNSLGPAELLLKYGTDKQKEKWLKNLATGKDIPCFGLTSEQAGSDAGSLVDYGKVIKKKVNNKEKIGIELTFNKRYITLAPVATVMGVAFKLIDPDNILGDNENLGITLALIPTNKKGIDNSHRHNPMNLSFMNGPISGNKVFIEMDEIIGGENEIGKGWNMLVECLSAGRGISLPALSGAIAQNCVRTTTAYSLIREQFNSPIYQFEGIKESLLKIITNNHIINATRELTNKGLDLGNNASVISAITKYHTTEMARESLQETMDILGGKAIIQGDLNPISDAYKGIPVAITVEGANILTRYLMIFGQGSIRCHEFLLDEIKAINHEDKEQGKEDFHYLFLNHVKSTSSKSITSLLSSLTLLFLNPAPKSKFSNEIKQINQLSRALNIISDITLLDLGGKLKYKEYLSSRLGDVLSNLFMATAVIFNNKDNKDIELSKYAIETLLYNAHKSLSDFLNNYPSLGKSIFMKSLNFPYGIDLNEPKFKNHSYLVEKYIYDSELRENELNESVGIFGNTKLFEDAYHIHIELNTKRKSLKDKVYKNLHSGSLEHSIFDKIEYLFTKNEINKEEKDFLIKYFELKREVIRVNSEKKKTN